jgi:hypothetical protein
MNILARIGRLKNMADSGLQTVWKGTDMKTLFKTAGALALLCAAVWCSAEAGAQTIQISRLAVMPLACGIPSMEQGRQAVDSRETELSAQGQTIEQGAEAVVTRCLQQALEKELPGLVVLQNETAGAEQLLAYMKKTETLKAHALKLGAQVQASHVLAGTVVHYRQRKGTAYGADKPASVAFSVYLLDVKTGDVIWTGAFDKTQQSLSENLLDAPAFFKGGAKWLTVEELTCGGAETVAKKLKGAITGAGEK